MSPRARAPGRRKLSPVGSAWYRGLHVAEAEIPEAVVTIVVYYEKAPRIAGVIGAFEEHVWPMSRFHSCVKDGYFVPVQGEMDREYHFAEVSIESEDEVKAWVEDVMCVPLDHSRPLWKVTILRAGTGRSALIFRMHHVIGDGLGLLLAFLPLMSCSDRSVIDAIPLPPKALGKSAPRRGRQRGRCSICGLFRAIFCCPRRLYRGIRGGLSLIIVRADSDIKMNMPVSKRLPFLRFSGRHTFTRMPPVPLDHIHKVRLKCHCTFNDVVMAAFAGAVRRYNACDLEDPLFKDGRKLECKCTMLLALPRPVKLADPSVSLHNKIITPLCRLAIDAASTADRLRSTIETCNRLKDPDRIRGQVCLTRLFTALLPTRFLQKASSKTLSSCSFNVSSVPLTNAPVHFLGELVDECHGVFVNNVPQVMFISYNGFLYWNMICDPELVPKPITIGEYFKAEIESMAFDPRETSCVQS